MLHGIGYLFPWYDAKPMGFIRNNTCPKAEQRCMLWLDMLGHRLHWLLKQAGTLHTAATYS